MHKHYSIEQVRMAIVGFVLLTLLMLSTLGAAVYGISKCSNELKENAEIAVNWEFEE